MALDVTALADYVKENQDELLVGSLWKGETADLIRSKGNVHTDVATSIQLNELETDAVFQAGGGCGFNASGTTKITRRALVVAPIKVHEAVCPKDLKKKYTQLKMKAGSQPQDFWFEKMWTDRKIAKIQKALETADWQGDTASGSAQLNNYDGFIKIIDATITAAGLNATPKTSPTVINAFPGTGTITSSASTTAITGSGTAFTTQVAVGDKLVAGGVVLGTVTVVGSNTSITIAANSAAAVTAGAFTIVPKTSVNFAAPILAATGIVAANVRSIITSAWKAIPADVKGSDDLYLLTSWDIYETYIAALIEANLFHYTAENKDRNAGEITIPGTQYILKAVHGLDSQNRIYPIRISNMHAGCELDGEESKFEVFWAKEADQLRFMLEFKRGTQVAYPEEITVFALA